MVTEVVDERLFSDLNKAGLLDGDARHLMYAIHNKCDRFVTLDTDDLLPKRSRTSARSLASACKLGSLASGALSCWTRRGRVGRLEPVTDSSTSSRASNAPACCAICLSHC